MGSVNRGIEKEGYQHCKMTNFLLPTFCCVFLTMSGGGAVYAQCPNGWEDGTSHDLGCIKLNPRYLRWDTAVSYCSRQTWGGDTGHLVEIKTSKAQEFVASKIKASSLKHDILFWWIGLTDRDSEGTWRWTHSSTSVRYTNWGSGLLDNAIHEYYDGEDCGCLYKKADYKWNDCPCNYTLYSVCEVNLQGTCAVSGSFQGIIFPSIFANQVIQIVFELSMG